MIGSSNGAAMHLCAALEIPWLPQNFLFLVKHNGIDPDEAKAAIEEARVPATMLLEANPELELHHMRDPNQDRLMCQLFPHWIFLPDLAGQMHLDLIRQCTVNM